MKSLEEYIALPYTMTVRWSAEDNLFVARVKEIDGCTGHGETEAEAIVMLKDNLREWIAFSLECGDQVPVPADAAELPSGKWLQRVPRSLHAALTTAAEEECVSLNQLVVSILAKEMGLRDGIRGVVSSLGGAAPAVADPWAMLPHSLGSRWHFDKQKVFQSSEGIFVKNLLAGLPKETISVSLEKDHGKNEKDNWN